MARAKGFIGFLLKISITVVLLFLLLRKTDTSAVISTVWKVGPGVLSLAIGIMSLLSFLVAARWRLIIFSLGHKISFYESWRIVVIGLFFNQCLPSGIGGDVARVLLATRLGLSRGLSIVSVAVDRLFALAAVGVCMVAGLWWLPRGKAFVVDATLSAFVISGFVILLGADRGVALMERHTSVAKYKQWRKIRPVTEFSRTVSRTFLLALRGGRATHVILWTSLVNQLALGAIIFLIGTHLDPRLQLIDALLLFPPAMLLSTLPISLGGWGVREGSMVLFLGAAGISPTAALATSLTFGIAMTLAGLIGGILWLVQPRGATSPSVLAAFSSER